MRVRGIYATALTIILRRRGYPIVDASRVLQERLGLPLLTGPATVTVKSTEDILDDVLVFAYPWDHGPRVESDLLEELEYAAVRRSRYGNNTVAWVAVEKGRDECTAVLPDGRRARFRGACSQSDGGIVLATIVHDPPGGRGSPVAQAGVRLVGYYTILQWPGEGVSFSEHIRGPDRLAELTLAAQDAVSLREYHVRFRSNSRHAEPEQVRAELEGLLSEMEALRSSSPPGKPEVARRGEYLSIIRIPRPAKDKLDAVRSEASPTIRLHHSLKTFGRTESHYVDCAEYAAKLLGAPEPGNGLAIMGFLAENSPRRSLAIDHLRPDGSRVRLGPFNVEAVTLSPDRLVLRLSREARSRGVYDGLGEEKRPGDRMHTTLDTSSWVVLHEYTRSDGRPIGVYANINTPPEVGHGQAKYLDLYIDVVKRPGQPAEIIDDEELDKAYEEGLLTRPLYRKALEEAEKARRRLDSTY